MNVQDKIKNYLEEASPSDNNKILNKKIMELIKSQITISLAKGVMQILKDDPSLEDGDIADLLDDGMYSIYDELTDELREALSRKVTQKLKGDAYHLVSKARK